MPPNLSTCENVNIHRLPRKVAACLVAGAVICPCLLQARIGETQDVLEKRLLQPGLGKLYPRTPATADAAKDRPRKKEDDPLKDIRSFLPGETREMLYWKSAVANQLSNDSGWKVDVFYVAGRSVLEAYKRVGDTLNEFEIRGILNANRGSSSWKKNGDASGGDVNGIGYDYELEDGSMRAKLQDNWIIVFATKLDNYVMQQQQVAKAAKDALLNQQKREQALKAPESVSGF